MSPGAWLPGWATGERSAALGLFMQDKEPVAFPLRQAQAEDLRRQIFGDRIEIVAGINACFTCRGAWTLNSDQGAIYSLKDAARISQLTFRIAKAGQGAGAALQARMDGDKNEAIVGEAQLKEPARPITIGGERGDPIVEIIPLTNRALDPSVPQIALRQWGDAEATVAMMRAAFKVPVSNGGAPVSEFQVADGLFTRQASELAPKPPRPLPEKAGPVVEYFEGVMSPLDLPVRTGWGPFTIRGDQLEVQPKPAGDAEVAKTLDPSRRLPPSGTRASIECIRDEFTKFKIRGLLTHYGLVLPDRAKPDCPPASTVAQASDAVWSRMDFSGTELCFVLGGARGHRPPARNARAVVAIGSSPAAPATWPELDAIAPVEIALDGATLQVRRPADRLAPGFRFARLALKVGPLGARIIPMLRRGVGGAGEADEVVGTPPPGYDDRALLIVDFPPQHVAEKAYLRRINEGVELPELPLSIVGQSADSFFARVDALGAGDMAARIRARENELKIWRDLRETYKNIAEKDRTPDQKSDLARLNAFSDVRRLLHPADQEHPDDDWQSKLASHRDFGKLLRRWQDLPEDQRIYLGTDPVVTDPDARAVIFAIWQAYRVADRAGPNPRLDELAAQLPDVTLDPAVEQGILRNLKLDPDKEVSREDKKAIPNRSGKGKKRHAIQGSPRDRGIRLPHGRFQWDRGRLCRIQRAGLAAGAARPRPGQRRHARVANQTRPSRDREADRERGSI